MEGVGHAFENLFEADHLVEEALDVVVHDVFLAAGDGVRAVLEGCYMGLVRFS